MGKFDGKCAWCSDTELQRRCNTLQGSLISNLKIWQSLTLDIVNEALKMIPDQWKPEITKKFASVPKCKGFRNDGNCQQCCFSLVELGKPAQRLFMNQCMWCCNTELEKKCKDEKLRKLLIANLKLWKSSTPNVFDEAMNRIPQEWKTKITEDLATNTNSDEVLHPKATSSDTIEPPAKRQRKATRKRNQGCVGQNEACIFSTTLAGQPAFGRYNKKCKWCNPEILLQNCADPQKQKLLIRNLKTLKTFHPPALDKAYARLPQQYKETIENAVNEEQPPDQPPEQPEDSS